MEEFFFRDSYYSLLKRDIRRTDISNWKCNYDSVQNMAFHSKFQLKFFFWEFLVEYSHENDGENLKFDIFEEKVHKVLI